MLLTRKSTKKIIITGVISACVLIAIPFVSALAFATPDDFNEPPMIVDDAIILPEGPEGYHVSLFGSDRKEVIDLNGNISKPIQDVNVKLIYKLSKEGKKDVITKNIDVFVPARSDVPKGSNKKPDIIPAIREWAGGDGEYILQKDARIIITDESLRTVAETFQKDLYDITNISLEISTDEALTGDIYLDRKAEMDELGDDGYLLDSHNENIIHIQAASDKGIYYGAVTFMQVLKLDETHTAFPKGIIRDYPKYEMRGMMMDVARKYIPIEFLNDYVKYLSWYKMSDIEIHLNDNEIFGDNASRPYPVSGRKPYSAFRLESDIAGLTSTDGHYTKDEFRQFQKDAASIGVNVIPEIDVPGHSMAFTKVRPDLTLVDPTSYKGASYDHVEKYLDVRNPETLPFVKSVFDEYMDGPNPVFVGKDVHFGTDEYSNSYDTQNVNKAFRNFANEMIDYVNTKPHYVDGEVDGTYDAYLWGGYSRYGTEGVNTNATLFNWNQGFGNPVDMVNLGFDIINIDDRNLYIVPGSPVEPAYPQNLNNADLYKNWEAIKFVGKTPFPSGHPQIKGGMFAIWNDNIGNGKSVADLYEVSKQSVQVLADKNWAGDEGVAQRNFDIFTKLGEKLADAPNADLDHKEEATNNIVIDADFEQSLTTNKNEIDGAILKDVVNVDSTQGKYGQGAEFKGNQSYIQTNIKALGFGWSAEMWIKPDQSNEKDTTLLESNPESKDLHTSVKLKQGKTNKIGFTVENYDHYFDFELPSGVWTHIALTGDKNGTSLYVNGNLLERLEGNLIPDGNYSGPKYYQTLQLPIAYIGGTSNAFVGVLDDVKVFNKVISPEQILQDSGIIMGGDTGNVALKKNVMSENVDYANPPHRTLKSINDGVITTDVDNRWAPHVSGTSQKDYRFVIDFESVQSVNKAILYERIFNPPSAAVNVTIQKFIGDDNSDAWKKDQNWETIKSFDTGLAQKGTTLEFEKTRTRMLRFIIKTTPEGSTWRDLSLMEVEVYSNSIRGDFNNALQQAVEVYNMVHKKLANSIVLKDAISESVDALTNADISDEDILQLITKLETLSDKALKDYRLMNIAKGKPASASGKESNLDRLGPDKAFDGNYTDMVNGRWSSEVNNNNAWIEVDLERIEEIDQVNIWWETAYAKKFILQISEDGKEYKDVYVQNQGTGEIETITFEPIHARYVRMQGVQRRTDHADVQTYSIFEMEVFRHGLLQATHVDLGEDIRMLEGTVKELNPVFQPEDATDIAVSFASSDESVVSVSQTGQIIAHKTGVAIIQVELDNNPEVNDRIQVIVIVPGTKDDLRTAIIAADKISQYEIQMLDKVLAEAFITIYRSAQDIYKNNLAMQSEIDEVVEELNDIVYAIRKDDLAAYITKAEIIIKNSAHYEEEGKVTLEATYDAALLIHESDESSHDEIMEVKSQLKQAIQSMQIIDTDELENEYRVAKLYNLDAFTEESKKGFSEALLSAEQRLEAPISSIHVAEVRLNLNKHVNALRYNSTKENFNFALSQLSSMDMQVLMSITDIINKTTDNIVLFNVFHVLEIANSVLNHEEVEK